MTQRLSILRSGLMLFCSLLIVGQIVWAPAAEGSDKPPKTNVRWDEQASKDVAAALHRMHEVANSGDIEALKKLIVGDDILVTFELDSDNRTPVPLRSKQDVFRFFDQVAKEASSQSANFVLDMPKMNCRATSELGVCTEECTVRLKLANGSERVDKLFGTAVAVKYEDGWKWIQWHMSIGGSSGRAGNDAKAKAHGEHTNR